LNSLNCLLYNENGLCLLWGTDWNFIQNVRKICAAGRQRIRKEFRDFQKKKETKRKILNAKRRLPQNDIHAIFFCNLCRYFINSNWIFFEHSRLYRNKSHVWLHYLQKGLPLLISNFPHVLNVVFFSFGGDSPVSEFYVSTSVPKSPHIKFRRLGITKNK